MGNIHARDAQVDGIGTPSAMASPETCSVVSGTSSAVWEVDDTSRDIFDWAYASWSVEVSEDAGSTWQALGTAEFDLQYLIGRININNYTTNSGTVTNIDDVRIADGQYYPYAKIAATTSITFNPSRESVENLQIGDDGERRTYTMLDVEITIDRDDFDLEVQTPAGTKQEVEDVLRSGALYVVSEDHGADGVRRGLVRVSDDTISGSPGELQGSAVTFMGSQVDPALADQTVRIVRWKT